jgi:hypothetical protein
MGEVRVARARSQFNPSAPVAPGGRPVVLCSSASPDDVDLAHGTDVPAAVIKSAHAVSEWPMLPICVATPGVPSTV